jgi:hypothetical protein
MAPPRKAAVAAAVSLRLKMQMRNEQSLPDSFATNKLGMGSWL